MGGQPNPSGQNDQACVEFLQWALPRLGLRWPGFRKVRGQVCKRVRRRMKVLGIDTIPAYRAYLERNADEWPTLDSLCQITISRFYRDREVFRFLETRVFPALAGAAADRGDTELCVWSAGCGSGEEPYSIAILWQQALQYRFPDLHLNILATDANAVLLRRARAACYHAGSLKALPESWRRSAFEAKGAVLQLRQTYVHAVDFQRQDVRQNMPGGLFDLILCRNLAFTYFGQPEQRSVLRALCRRLRDDGALVLGSHERLPEEVPELRPWSEPLRIYRKV